MSQSPIDLLHLPNELLLYILNKLDNVDVLYSLFGINNQRLHRLIQEKTFSTSLNFTSRTELILDRFCNSILPRIDFNLQCLVVESQSLERILLAGHYPHLTDLKILHFQRDNSLDYFTDHSSIEHIKEQIRKLHLVNEDRERVVGSLKDYTNRVYAHLLIYFNKVEYLNIIQTTIPAYPPLTICSLPLNSFSSQILSYLSINVRTFDDCLCLLDGRLQQLSTFIVRIYSMNTNSSVVHNSDILPNLKCFSFIYYGSIKQYHRNQILSLLRRMIYLDQLTFYLRFDHQKVFIHPINILNEFLLSVSRLISLKFSLSIEYNREDLVDYLSNNDMKENYPKIGYEQTFNTVSYCIDTGTLNMFTVPFEFDVVKCLGNQFPNIVFKYVIELWVHDMLPFEHEFFLRIAKAFPLLKQFYVTDLGESPHSKNISDDIQSDEIISYPQLTLLDITRADFSNVERFLNEKKIHLPCLIELHVLYQDLTMITNNFTRETTRKNCTNVTRLITRRQIVGSKDYYDYFPSL